MIEPWENRLDNNVAMPKAKILAMQSEIKELRSALFHSELAVSEGFLNNAFHFGPYIDKAGITASDIPQQVINKLQMAIQEHFRQIANQAETPALSSD